MKQMRNTYSRQIVDLFGTSHDANIFLQFYWPSSVYYRNSSATAMLHIINSLEFSDPENAIRSAYVKAKAHTLSADGKHISRYVSNEIAALAYHAAQATICLNSIDKRDSSLGSLVNELREFFNFAISRECVVHCNAYLSRIGCGVPCHVDNHDVFVIQLMGEKQWSLTIPQAYTHSLIQRCNKKKIGSCQDSFSVKKSEQTRDIAINMTPGSLLFVPRGTIHKTIAISDSISITIGVK